MFLFRWWLLAVLVVICISTEAVDIVFQQSLEQYCVHRKHNYHRKGEAHEVYDWNSVVPHRHSSKNCQHPTKSAHHKCDEIDPCIYTIQHRVEVNLENWRDAASIQIPEIGYITVKFFEEIHTNRPYSELHKTFSSQTFSVQKGNVFSRVCMSVCSGGRVHVIGACLNLFTWGPSPIPGPWICSNLFTCRTPNLIDLLESGRLAFDWKTFLFSQLQWSLIVITKNLNEYIKWINIHQIGKYDTTLNQTACVNKSRSALGVVRLKIGIVLKTATFHEQSNVWKRQILPWIGEPIIITLVRYNLY